MSANDGSRVRRKAFRVRAAQTVLSNGVFAEESPASSRRFRSELNRNKMPDN